MNLRRMVNQTLVDHADTSAILYNYSSTFSASFILHLQAVRNENDYDSNDFGVRALGEPSIDPSRAVQDNGLDSDWLDEYRIN
jgi:hypothetical protein